MLTGNKGWETIASAKWIKADSSLLMHIDEEGGEETNRSGLLSIDVVPCFESGKVTGEKLNVEVSPLEVWTICVWLGSIWIFEIGEVTWGELNAEVSPLEVWNVNVWLGLIWIECKLLCTGDTGCGENLTGTST